jgi:hypothetical protein
VVLKLNNLIRVVVRVHMVLVVLEAMELGVLLRHKVWAVQVQGHPMGVKHKLKLTIPITKEVVVVCRAQVLSILVAAFKHGARLLLLQQVQLPRVLLIISVMLKLGK